jgi:hypothetical protein
MWAKSHCYIFKVLKKKRVFGKLYQAWKALKYLILAFHRKILPVSLLDSVQPGTLVAHERERERERERKRERWEL